MSQPVCTERDIYLDNFDRYEEGQFILSLIMTICDSHLLQHIRQQIQLLFVSFMRILLLHLSSYYRYLICSRF